MIHSNKTKGILSVFFFFLMLSTKVMANDAYFVDAVVSKTETLSINNQKVVLILFDVKGPAKISTALSTIKMVAPPDKTAKQLVFIHEVTKPDEVEKLSASINKPVNGIAVDMSQKWNDLVASITQYNFADKEKPYLEINGVVLHPMFSFNSDATPTELLQAIKKTFDFVPKDSLSELVTSGSGENPFHNISLQLKKINLDQALDLALDDGIAFVRWNTNWFNLPNVFEKLAAHCIDDNLLLEYMWALSKTKTLDVIKKKFAGVDASLTMNSLPHSEVYDYAIKEFNKLSLTKEKIDFLDDICIESGCFSDEKLKDFITQGLALFKTNSEKDEYNIDLFQEQLTLFEKRQFNHLYDFPTLLQYIEKVDKSDDDIEEIYEGQRIQVTGTLIENEYNDFYNYTLKTKVGQYDLEIQFKASHEEMLQYKKGDTVSISGLIDMAFFDEDEESSQKEIEIDLGLCEVFKK